jgi:hypothetical protein
LPEYAARSYKVVVLDESSAVKDAPPQILGLSLLPWFHDLFVISRCPEEESLICVQGLLGDLSRFLKRLTPRLIVFHTDTSYLERAFSIVARNKGIPTVTIQHGLFAESTFPALREGEASDSIAVWGRYFQEMVCSVVGLPQDRVPILGYPYDLPERSPVPAAGKNAICFLGQPFEHFDDRLLESKRRAITQTVRACRAAGLQFRYRLHYAEDRSTVAPVLPAGALLPQDQTLAEAFRTHGAFLSLTSTALIEAGLHGRAAVQVVDQAFGFDLKGLDVCYRCEADQGSLNACLAEYAAGRLPPHPVNPNYVSVPESLPDAVLELIERCCDRPRAFQISRVSDGDSAGKLLPTLDTLSVFPDSGADVRIPAWVEVEPLRAQIGRWTALAQTGRPAGALVIDDCTDGFLLPLAAALFGNIKAVVFVTDPLMSRSGPRLEESRALRWIMRFNALLAGSDSLPRLFLFPDVSDSETDSKLQEFLSGDSVTYRTGEVAAHAERLPSIEAFPGTTPVLLSMAKALYAHARSVFPEGGFAANDGALRALTAVSEEMCDSAVRIAWATVSANVASVESRGLGRLIWISDEFARLREGKLWRLRENVARLSRLLRGR